MKRVLPEAGGRRTRYGTIAALLALGALLDAAGAAGTAGAATVVRVSGAPVGPSVRLGGRVGLASGVTYQEFSYPASHGTAHGHLLTVNQRDPHVLVDLLTPGRVTARATVSRLADARGAVGAVNGDFFDISETQHPGVEATGAAVGPQIVSGAAVKAAVPDGQRFGPALPVGTSARDVIGVATDHTARLDRLTLRGAVTARQGSLPLGGYNQYALPVGGIGAYTSAWGTGSRRRAVCGTDLVRADPCSEDTYEVRVRGGRVVGAANAPGSGAIAAGTTVLLGREAGARWLRDLRVGDTVSVTHRLAAQHGTRFAFALGAFPVLRGGAPLAGLDNRTAATRTAAGFGPGGQVLYLLALDGNAEFGSGLTIRELASVMQEVGADGAANLDGGGSSALAAQDPGGSRAIVRNHPSGGAERPVPNAIGVFWHP
jgi:hypothetical protein